MRVASFASQPQRVDHAKTVAPLSKIYKTLSKMSTAVNGRWQYIPDFRDPLTLADAIATGGFLPGISKPPGSRSSKSRLMQRTDMRSGSTSKRVEMLPAKRQAMILEHLRTRGPTPIGELAAALGGSQSTVRRDLEHLMQHGYLERTYGGAVLVPPLHTTFESEQSISAQMRRAQKIAIGKAAAAMLNPRESVIFDGSTTVLEAVRAATCRDIPLTTITNSLDIAHVCAEVPNWRVVMPGGTIRSGTRFLVGDHGNAFFKTVHADVCFVGALAVTRTILTDASLEVSALKRAMLQSARRTVLLVDSSKFTSPAFCTFADLADIAAIITDDGVDPDVLAELRSQRAKVTVVSPANP